MADRKRKSGGRRRKPAPSASYRPSKAFLKYLTLVQACQASAEDADFAKTHAEREKVTREIAGRQSTSVSEIFEKIYVWRMESFDPDEAGQIYYDDMFPLSVYYDLKRLAKFEGAPSEADAQYEKALREGKEEKPSDKGKTLADLCARLHPAGSLKIH